MENLLQPVFEPADFVPERGSAAFFRDAAGRGSPAALSNLGVLYARGEGGVEKDGAEALKCFREAAGKNYPAGVLNLGIFLLTGPLESRDEHEAEKILTVEAEKGSPAAQCALGLLYSGRLYPAAADQESSLEWLRKSSAQGFPEADYLLALDSLEGRGVREDRSTAFALMGRAASSGVVAAQYRIGIFFRDGTGTAADFRNAAKWLRAALRGSPEAAAGLGNLYETGRGVQRDNQQAVMWYKKAEKIDPALGGYFLARMYEEGRGVTKSFHEAMVRYEISAAAGYPDAAWRLGKIYEEGRGTVIDLEKACRYYRDAAEHGSPDAAYRMGQLSESDELGGRDPEKACYWYKAAAEIWRAESSGAEPFRPVRKKA